MNRSNKMLVAVAVSAILGLLGPLAALAAGPAAVNLGSAGSFVILAKTGISTTGATSVTGNLGVSPAAASYITGFGLILPSYGAFSTSALVAGNIYASDYAVPTPANLTVAVGDMQTAYTDAVGRTNPTQTEMGAGNIGGTTLVPGLYKWGTDVTIPTNITLSGGPNDVWIFQIAGNLSVSSGVHVILSGGAQAGNVFWAVAGQTIIGTTAVFNGNILDQTAIVLNTGATLTGRALAQTAVTLDANTVSAPSFVAVTTTMPPPPVIVMMPPAATSGVVCSMEALRCPDGSFVSRQGLTCAFAACPAVVSQNSNQSGSSNANANMNVALQAQINGLLTTLHSLQAQAGQQTSTSGQQIRTIAGNLGEGARGNDVATLQQFLISQNKGPAAFALARSGATAYFGALTRAALAEFQASVGISPALGNFGSMTRAYVNTH